MKKLILCLVLGTMPLATLEAEAAAPIPKEGTGKSHAVYSGTLKVLPLGKGEAQIQYEVAGITMSDTGEGLLHNASVRCMGGMHVVNGEFNDESGACVYTRPDGDQVFQVHKAAGKAGVAAKGTFTFVGGTGKLAGIQGGGEFVRSNVRPAAEGMSQSFSQATMHYKLP